MEFKDRQPKYPNRVLITPESGGSPYYATVVRADEPTELGTPLNATSLNTLLSKDGGAMTGPITTKGIKLTSGVDYGTALPDTAPDGTVFFLIPE